MSSDNKTVWMCDICGKVETTSGSNRPAEWARIYLQRPAYTPQDWCKKCFEKAEHILNE